MQPLIGITGYYAVGSDPANKDRADLLGRDIGKFSYDYTRSIEYAGGLPVQLPLIHSRSIPALLDRLDGLLLSGGEDVSPLLYKEVPKPWLGKPDEARDEFEAELIRQALARDMPVLGICRGIQLLNVVLGGSLYQDLQQERDRDCYHNHLQYFRSGGTHPVTISENSKLYEALEAAELWVNSYHHQAIKTPGNGFVPTAVAHDGVIEAAESVHHSYVVAVQWHPEMMSAKYEPHLKLFKHFIQTVQNRKYNP